MKEEGDAGTFDEWLNPRIALDRVSNVVESATAASVILGRLKGGQIRSVAESFTRESGNQIVDSGEYFEIPPEYWNNRSSDGFWNSGDVEFELAAPFHSINFEVERVRCFTVRFDPIGVHKLIGNFPKKTTNWLKPHDALTAVQAAFPDIKVASKAITDRLKGGLLKAEAASSSWDNNNNLPTSACSIPASHWSHLSSATGSDWWDTGTITVRIYRRERQPPATGRYFGIKFDPAGVEAIIADAPKRPMAVATGSSTLEPMRSEVEEPPATVEMGPPVSDTLLSAWFELYQRAYTGMADTEENAWRSASGMFQGKSVSRARIRGLRGTRKRGRPSRNSGQSGD